MAINEVVDHTQEKMETQECERLKMPLNDYGNVDITHGVPANFAHIEGLRLTVTCKSIDVECAPALTSWHSGKPVIYGVIVRADNEARVREAILRRIANRLTPQQAEARRRRSQEKSLSEFAILLRERFPSMPESDILSCSSHATEIGSGRVGRSTTCDDPALAAAVAYVRHTYTSYDDNLTHGYDRDEARTEIGGKVSEILDQWEEQK